jgi:sialate O-acetylesterase
MAGFSRRVMIPKHPFTFEGVMEIVAASIMFVAPEFARAEIKLPANFSDHMVLQRDIQIPVWGWADAGEEVTVTFGDQRAKTITDNDGRWKVYLARVGANSTSQTLTVTGRNAITFTDVLVGDVWLCSGQSNMGVYLSECDNAGSELPKANDPLLRILTVEERTSIKPELDVKLWNGKPWRLCTPETAYKFSGVAYFFGRELRKHLGIPIGLISSVHGGSQAQLWTSVEAIGKNIDAEPEFKVWRAKREAVLGNYSQKLAAYLPAKEKYDVESTRYWNEVENASEFVARKKVWEDECKAAREQGKIPPRRPEPSQPRPTAPESPDGGPYNNFMVGNLYNAMIAPLIPYAIKGVIWYQGESNCDNSKRYRVVFPIMIADWRQKWGQGNFPFLFVQLPNIGPLATEPVQDQDRWPGIREAQTKALLLPNTGMATIIDVGDPDDVHGKDKMDVGVRLSLIARHLVYGEDIVHTGPTYASMKVEGKQVLITFGNTGSGLVIGSPPWTPSGNLPPIASELKGFAIAGSDQKWIWAKARINGDQVIVSSDHVPHPVAVRYGWADNPPCNLYNKAKLPAAPFRTGDWKPVSPSRTARN